MAEAWFGFQALLYLLNVRLCPQCRVFESLGVERDQTFFDIGLPLQTSFGWLIENPGDRRFRFHHSLMFTKQTFLWSKM